MSEEILKALMQLFALITKQDGGIGEKEISYVERLLAQLIGADSAGPYLKLYRETAVDEIAGEGKEDGKRKEDGEGKKLTSVLDSVRVLKLCKQISKTINQAQKVVVLVRILELVNSEYKLSEQRMGIVKTVADIFRISSEEYDSIFTFVTSETEEAFLHGNHLVVSRKRPVPDDIPLLPEDRKPRAHQYQFPGLKEPLFFLRVPSVELYFLKVHGEQECLLNGLGMHPGVIYIFSRGSTLRLPVGAPLLYSDIASRYQASDEGEEILMEAEDLCFNFPDEVVGLDHISFSAEQGNLVGIMGSSGSGKTTLLNVLSGMYQPLKGSVKINGIDLHHDASKLSGVAGFVPQDDLLIEELTVYENLYFNAKFCFRHLDADEIRQKVDDTLQSLSLFEKKDLKVGSVMNKILSGGQRKRLNIALELIREPVVLFLDEPTSGLSSRDSANVMDLLRELTLKGKLIFVVIHQPSSDLYKMFDRVLILDEGGKMVFYGNPVEAVIHFKEADKQVNAGMGECPVCGNVNPESIFNTMEALQVDDYGNYTDQRRVSPATWEEIFRERLEKEAEAHQKSRPPTRNESSEDLAGDQEENKSRSSRTHVNEQQEEIHPPPVTLQVPGWAKQYLNYLRRDIRSKLNKTQYLLMTLLVSPVLAFILATIIRYSSDPVDHGYLFRENENIPIYIFMALIVALFLGLIVSAEEIFRDRKILKRESFLQLSRSSYLLAKISTLVVISAIQAICFVLIANGILQIRHMTLAYWFALFSTAVCANLIGLVVSSAFNSAVTIYIVTPLVMIPMMVLSGAMFSFEKLNHRITNVDKVPLIAEVMPTKWSYEALMVHQFKANAFEKNFYRFEKSISYFNFKSAYLVPELEERLNQCIYEFRSTGSINTTASALEVLRNHLNHVDPLVKNINFDPGELVPENFSETMIHKCQRFLLALKKHYISEFSRANRDKERRLTVLMEERRDLYFTMLNDHHNEAVADRVKKIYEKNQIVEWDGWLYQQIDPVFMDPSPHGLGIRSHFYAPRKYFLGVYFETFAFNMAFIWFLSLLNYIILYFNLASKLMNSRLFKFRRR